MKAITSYSLGFGWAISHVELRFFLSEDIKELIVPSKSNGSFSSIPGTKTAFSPPEMYDMDNEGTDRAVCAPSLLYLVIGSKIIVHL